jgi:hypothetical protein
MPVLVGIEVRGGTTDEQRKPLELALELTGSVPFQRSGRERGASSRKPMNLPPFKDNVQADPELCPFASVFGSVSCPTGIDHQACARDDSVLVCLDNPTVNTVAAAEIVGVDDEPRRLVPVRGPRDVLSSWGIKRQLRPSSLP